MRLRPRLLPAKRVLYIYKGTVDTHARHIYKKCGVHSREELIDLVDAAEAR